MSTAPSDRKKLEKRRNDVERKLANLVAAIENGIALPQVHEQVAKRQAELRQIDEELETLERPADVNISVIPTWVEQQVRDLSGLLAESPQRAKDEFQRLNMEVTILTTQKGTSMRSSSAMKTDTKSSKETRGASIRTWQLNSMPGGKVLETNSLDAQAIIDCVAIFGSIGSCRRRSG